MNCPTQIIGLTSLPKCIDYTCVKGSHSANKKTKFWIQQRSKEATKGTSGLGAPDCPVHHRTVSGAPPDSVRCTRGVQFELATFGKIQSRRAKIHRTVRCTPDIVRCSNGTQLWNSPASGFYEGCSAIIHRTCPVCTGLSGASSEQRLLRANGHLRRI